MIDVGYDPEEILNAIRGQMEHGKYPPDGVYGDGKAGERIADTLAVCELTVQKRMTY